MGSARSRRGAGTTANSMTGGGVTPSTSPAPAGDATTEKFIIDQYNHCGGMG